MSSKLRTAAAATALVGTVFVWAPLSSGGGASSEASPGLGRVSRCSKYEPHLDPRNFVRVIDNPFFPLPVGRKWVYRGIKDGQSQIDRVVVTPRTKVVERIIATIVADVATHDGQLLEKTFDWYAQDKQGRVWYVGENTTHYLPNGKKDKSGSWEAGVHDAEPGIIMEAHPHIPDAYRQECFSGEAEDTAWVVNRAGSLTVPYGTVHGVLTTLEATRVEPGLYDQKIYGRGIGIVLERALTGPKEIARLVSVTG